MTPVEDIDRVLPKISPSWQILPGAKGDITAPVYTDLRMIPMVESILPPAKFSCSRPFTTKEAPCWCVQ